MYQRFQFVLCSFIGTNLKNKMEERPIEHNINLTITRLSYRLLAPNLHAIRLVGAITSLCGRWYT
jgi:hypothetical protein